jgi:hypothetical protein
MADFMSNPFETRPTLYTFLCLETFLPQFTDCIMRTAWLEEIAAAISYPFQLGNITGPEITDIRTK